MRYVSFIFPLPYSNYPTLHTIIFISHHFSCLTLSVFLSAIFAAEEVPIKIAASLRAGMSCPQALFKSFIDTGTASLICFYSLAQAYSVLSSIALALLLFLSCPLLLPHVLYSPSHLIS